MSREKFVRESNIRKIMELREKGINPYPYRYEKTHSVKYILLSFKELMKSQKTVKTAGRIISYRDLGSIIFVKLQDEEGEIQLIARKNITDKFEIFKKYVNRGDFIGVEGICTLTKTGEKSIEIRSFEILAKAIRALPEKYHGIQDPEYKYRHRYLDFIFNPEKREILKKRYKIIKEMRNFLDERGFIEIDTPVLQPVYGGAYARPFITYYNALERNFYLRIAPELYLKRLLIGGFEKVYEIGKNFRNEGMDATHNPEFLSLEFYQAYSDLYDIMKITENLIKHVTKKVNGSLKIQYQEHEINLNRFAKMSLEEALLKYSDIDVRNMTNEEIRELLEKKDILLREESRNYLIAKLFEEEVEEKLIQPTFILDYPKEISPLAKDHREKEGFVERFELFIGGLEIANAFSELNDPIEQRKRFEEEMRKKAEIEEKHPLDEDFIKALEYGMPPAGGCGIGIERLILILTNQRTIREIMAFPALRTCQESSE